MPRSRHARAHEPAVYHRPRHGHGLRGPVTGPHLPMLHNRIDRFEVTVASTADYLKGVWPEDLAGVRFEIASSPAPDVPVEPGSGGVDPGSGGPARWRVDHAGKRITLFRVPIQRLGKLHRDDEFHRRMYVESCVFRAVAELLGRDPWDLADGGFGPG